MGTLPVLFRTGTVTEDWISVPNVALILTLPSNCTTMLSFCLKQGPLIFKFVPPSIIPDRGEMVREPIGVNKGSNKITINRVLRNGVYWVYKMVGSITSPCSGKWSKTGPGRRRKSSLINGLLPRISTSIQEASVSGKCASRNRPWVVVLPSSGLARRVK